MEFAKALMLPRGTRRLSIAILLIFILKSNLLFADVVVTSDRVTNGVRIRAGATTQSQQIGMLLPGQQLEFIGSVPRWNQVRLNNDQLGFVSKSWTVVVADTNQRTYTLYVADVGTGLAVFVQGNDFSLIYDGGSNDDLRRGASNRFLSFLQSAAPNLATIDHLILSHPHRDHVELLPDMFAQYTVHHIWDSGRIHNICGYRAFMTAVSNETGAIYHSARFELGAHNIIMAAKNQCYGEPAPRLELQINHGSRIANEAVAIGEGATMTFLHANSSSDGSPNENSLVVQLDLGRTRVLLMGDAEAGGRADPATLPRHDSIEGMLLDCCAESIASDILVVGHHGSMTSSRRVFLDAVGADLFVVSSGPRRYGSVVLPDQIVINELAIRGQVFRTDLNDATCGQDSTKVGTRNDGRAGGCDNIQITVGPDGVNAQYWHPAN